MLITRSRGFTLIELMVTIALLAVLLGLAAPSFTTWTRNAQVRTVSDTLQNGARRAQNEALTRSRQVVFYLTNSSTCNPSAPPSPAADGSFWAIRTVPLNAGEAADLIQCSNVSDSVGGIAIKGPAAICFNSFGRLVANTSPGIGSAACTLSSTGITAYEVSGERADRRLQVLVSVGGQVRHCDPARVLSATNPDGCPS